VELRNLAFPNEILMLAHIMVHRSGIKDGHDYGDFITAMGSEGVNSK